MSKIQGTRKIIGVSLLGVILFLAGVITQDPYIMHVMTRLCINIMLAASLWLIFTTGELSLTHVGMMAIGAYSSAVLATRLDLSVWITLFLGGVIAAFISFILGFPALKLKGFAFFIVTFAFAEIVIITLANFWQDIFGGAIGLVGIPHPPPIPFPGFEITFSSGTSMYYLTLIIMVLSLLFIYGVVKSRFGRISRAIAQTDILGESIGIDVLRHKVMAFTMGGFFAGIAGGLYAHNFTVIAPYDFGLTYMITMIASVLVGGSASIFGPMIGACLFVLLHTFMAGLGHLEVLFTGIIIIVVMRFLPGGLLSLPAALRHLLRQKPKLD